MLQPAILLSHFVSNGVGTDYLQVQIQSLAGSGPSVLMEGGEERMHHGVTPGLRFSSHCPHSQETPKQTNKQIGKFFLCVS